MDEMMIDDKSKRQHTPMWTINNKEGWTTEYILDWVLGAAEDQDNGVFTLSDKRFAETLSKAMNVYETYLVCEQERAGLCETEDDGEPESWPHRTVRRLFRANSTKPFFPRIKEEK